MTICACDGCTNTFTSPQPNKLYCSRQCKTRQTYRRRASTPSGIRSKYAKSAKERSLDFDLTREWIESNFITDVCSLSGVELYYGPDEWHPRKATIDRIDSNKGYTMDNCRVVCLAVNIALSTWGLDEFLPIARGMLQNRPGEAP